MSDEVRYPVIYPSDAGPYAVLRAHYKRSERGRVQYREDVDYGTGVLSGLSLPSWCWAELGKPRTLTVVVGAGPWIGRTADLFGWGRPTHAD